MKSEKLNEKIIKEIKEARKRIQQGEFYTQKEVEKILLINNPK